MFNNLKNIEYSFIEDLLLINEFEPKFKIYKGQRYVYWKNNKGVICEIKCNSNSFGLSFLNKKHDLGICIDKELVILLINEFKKYNTNPFITLIDKEVKPIYVFNKFKADYRILSEILKTNEIIENNTSIFSVLKNLKEIVDKFEIILPNFIKDNKKYYENYIDYKPNHKIIGCNNANCMLDLEDLD